MCQDASDERPEAFVAHFLCCPTTGNTRSAVVLARELSEAERVLREAGIEMLEVWVTSPPRAPRPSGPWRVVRQRSRGRDVQLVVAAAVAPPESVSGKAPDTLSKVES